MNGTTRSAAILAALLLVMPAAGRAAGDLDGLVRKVIEAYGGEQALRGSPAIRESGQVISTMARGQGTVSRSYEYPDRLRVEITFPGEGGETRILAGDKGWRQGSAVSGPQLDSMALQAARLALPLALLERRGALRESGSVSRGGKELRVIEYPPAAGMNMAVEIDPDSGRILRTTGSSRGGTESAVTIEFITEYGDFRSVNGVLIPFREHNFAMGMRTGETILKRAELLPGLPPETFAP